MTKGAPEHRRGGAALGQGVRFYPHRDLETLARTIRKTKQGVIAVTGVEPGTGEIAPLAELIKVLPEDQCLIVDDCRGTGVLGEHGRGSHPRLSTKRRR